MARKATKAELVDWTKDLRDEIKAVKRGSRRMYFVLRHVSSSGMSRSIDVYTMGGKGKNWSKRWLSYRVAAVTENTFSEKYESVIVGGCGMDMGFHLFESMCIKAFGTYEKAPPTFTDAGTRVLVGCNHVVVGRKPSTKYPSGHRIYILQCRADKRTSCIHTKIL